MSYSMHYGVLVGTPKKDFEKGHHPHLRIKLDIGKGCDWTVAVNVKDYSGQNIFFVYKENIKATFIDSIRGLNKGAYRSRPEQGGFEGVDYIPEGFGGVDYMRGGFVEEKEFKQYDHIKLSAILEDKISSYIDQESKKLYCIGSLFPQGIHDIHMNQGEHESDRKNNDGCLLFYDGGRGTFDGAFFYFISQKW